MSNENTFPLKKWPNIHIFRPHPTLSYGQPRSLKCTRGTAVRGYPTHSLTTYLAPTDRPTGRPPARPNSIDVGFLANRAGAQGVGAGVSATTIVDLELPRLPERLVGVAEAVLCGRAQIDR
jgi:hypothetical protein